MRFSLFRNQYYVHNISCRNSTLNIQIKIYLQSFVSVIYYLNHSVAFTFKSIIYNWKITLNYWFICEKLTAGVTFETAPGTLVYLHDLSDRLFLFFLCNHSISCHFLYYCTHMFYCSYSLVFPPVFISSLHWAHSI